MKTEERLNDTMLKHQNELVELIERFSNEDGVHSTAIPALHLIRAPKVSEPIRQLFHTNCLPLILRIVS